MDTVFKRYGPYIKLTWTEYACNQLQPPCDIEVFANINNIKIISAYYWNGPLFQKLKNPRLVCDKELGWELHFTKCDHVNECEQETYEIVHIEEIKKEEFEAASSNKENMQSLKF